METIIIIIICITTPLQSAHSSSPLPNASFDSPSELVTSSPFISQQDPRQKREMISLFFFNPSSSKYIHIEDQKNSPHFNITPSFSHLLLIFLLLLLLSFYKGKVVWYS